MEHEKSNDFCHNRKMYNFEPYNVLLAVSTNIPVLLMTAFVLQDHILPNKEHQKSYTRTIHHHKESNVSTSACLINIPKRAVRLEGCSVT